MDEVAQRHVHRRRQRLERETPSGCATQAPSQGASTSNAVSFFRNTVMSRGQVAENSLLVLRLSKKPMLKMISEQNTKIIRPQSGLGISVISKIPAPI